MRTEWDGYYLDGRTAERRGATIRLMRTGLEITPEGGRALWWPYAELRQTQGFYAGEQVRLERGGELSEAILLSDAAFLTDLHRVAPEATTRFHDPRRRRMRVRLTLAAAAAVITIVTALYLWGIPALAALAAARVPVPWEVRLGEAVVEHLAPPKERCAGPAATRSIDRLVAILIGPLTDTPYTFRVIVIDSPAVNAFAAPGGYVVVLRGLIERARSPEELAGILAHELQHVIRRHPTRALLQHASTGLLLAALAGDVSGAMVYGLESARVLGTLRYSRAHEAEADAEAIRMLLAAGIDPAGLIAFLDSLQEERRDAPAVLAYLSTHPSPADRSARLRSLVPAGPRTRGPLLAAEDWLALQRICVGADRSG